MKCSRWNGLALGGCRVTVDHHGLRALLYQRYILSWLGPLRAQRDDARLSRPHAPSDTRSPSISRCADLCRSVGWCHVVAAGLKAQPSPSPRPNALSASARGRAGARSRRSVEGPQRGRMVRAKSPGHDYDRDPCGALSSLQLQRWRLSAKWTTRVHGGGAHTIARAHRDRAGCRSLMLPSSRVCSHDFVADRRTQSLQAARMLCCCTAARLRREA